MMIDPSVLRRKQAGSRGLVARRVGLSVLGFAVLGTVIAVRDIEHGVPAGGERQSAAMLSHEGPVWSDKVTVVSGENIGG